jgi:hypothetical protein
MAIKEVIPFNFDEIYSYIENKFKEKGYDTQEGSNTMQLVTAMSYLTSMLNANTAININETLLTQARKRNMVLQDARILGYEIDHTQSYRYMLTLNFITVGTHKIKKYTSFTANSMTYYYMGQQLEDIVVSSADAETRKYYVLGMSEITCKELNGTWDAEFNWATFEISDESVISNIENKGYELLSYTGVMKKIEVREGVLHKYVDNESVLTRVIELENIIDSDGVLTQGVKHYIDIPFTDVEENGLDVFLTYIDEDGQFHEKELWKKSASFMIDKDTVLNKEYARLDNIEYRTPRIYFKLGEIGNELRVGTFIYINVLTSSGVLGAMTETPKANELKCDVRNYELVLQGAKEESISSIKQNAPLFHNTANRVITKPDYIAFCKRQATVKYADVWDGHDEYPSAPGHIWFSFIPSNNIRSMALNTDTNSSYYLENEYDAVNWYIEEAEVQNIWDFLDNFKIPTLIFHHRHPIYMDFSYDVEVVRYGVATTRKEQHAEIFEVINDYFMNAVERFKFEYFNSNLTRRIDNKLSDITGFNISLTTSIVIGPKHVIQETIVDKTAQEPVYYKEIRFHLGLPFEKAIDDDGSIIKEKMPDIRADIGENVLRVDYDTETFIKYSEDINETGTIKSYDIKLGDEIVGKLRIFNVIDPDIEVILYIKDDEGGYTNGIAYASIDNEYGLTINVAYPSPNIRFYRNTIPRLKTVNFV